MKRIYKIEDGKKVCGVCGGVAEYFDIDPTLIRVIWLLAVLGAGVGVGVVSAVPDSSIQ